MSSAAVPQNLQSVIVELPKPGSDAKTAAVEKTRALWRRRLFAALGAVVCAVALGAGGWWYFTASGVVSTDDAYVGASIADVTPLVNGPVREVLVHETQTVRRGSVLVILDPADEAIALAQAEANYAAAKRHVSQAFASAAAARAQVAAREADLKGAELNYERRVALAAVGAISAEVLTMSRNALDTARAGVGSARGQLDADLALVDGRGVDDNPEVLAAKAALDAARLALARTVIRAPVDGIVAQLQVQVGQRVAIGMTLMTVVPVSQVYVDANFKEGELKNIRIGQPVELTSDLYGGDVIFHGHVAGLGGGTGSAFALIPAQNATGNWIKVVQRLPVRIALDPGELVRHPLRVGLSMAARISVAGRAESFPRPAPARAIATRTATPGLHGRVQTIATVAQALPSTEAAGLPGRSFRFLLQIGPYRHERSTNSAWQLLARLESRGSLISLRTARSGGHDLQRTRSARDDGAALCRTAPVAGSGCFAVR